MYFSGNYPQTLKAGLRNIRMTAMAVRGPRVTHGITGPGAATVPGATPCVVQ
jgi:hypothetical protein